MRVPLAVGVNVTVIMHEVVAAKMAGQLLVCAKSPETEIEEMKQLLNGKQCTIIPEHFYFYDRPAQANTNELIISID